MTNRFSAIRAALVAVDGPALRTTVHEGTRWYGGVLQQRYAIHIKNPTHTRVLAVTSVDGLSTMNGEPASYIGGGMIIAAHSEVTIDGWRTSLESVAAFRISTSSESYATKTFDANNVGIVGVAIFGEREVLRARSMRPGVTRGGAARGSAGTSYGESVSSHVTAATFNRASAVPEQVHLLRYDTTASLIAAGILSEIEADTPNPFPANASPFCQPPK